MWPCKIDHLSGSQLRMDRVNNVRLRVVGPRQIVAAFSYNLIAFVAKQPLVRWIHILQKKHVRYASYIKQGYLC